jgi:cyclophilin family peptidyl-prolyl cis-trans isomerase
MHRRALIAATIGEAMLAKSAEAAGLDLQNTIYMDLTYGRVVIALRPDLAPKNVAQVEKLVREHFYDGTPFWRVIAGFMAQGGDPTGSGTGGSNLPDLPAEFTDSAKFLRGTVGMARTQDPNSANSQFFICLAPATFLDGKYTIVGQVVQGMQYVDEIKKGSGQNGAVQNPDRIVHMTMAADAKN